MKATYFKYQLQFKQASGTSRGILTSKDTWFIQIKNGSSNGIGECGMFKGLSIDDRTDFETQLLWVCQNIHLGLEELSKTLTEFPSIQFGLEMAFQSLKQEGSFELFPSNFTKGQDSIPINGLIWMGDKSFMKQQIKDKLAAGFSCIKLKIGAIDFDTEYKLLKTIRSQFNAEELTLRVDANGAFSADEARGVLADLSKLNIHSIEQPIKANQWDEMAKLCESTPVPIALDEELIGIVGNAQPELLDHVKPQFVIFKPTLLGGFKATDQWMALAKARNIDWWLTSALEANIGLNAICQYTFFKGNTLPQGLGTGSLFDNNIPSPLLVEQGYIHANGGENWNLSLLNFEN